MPTPVIELINVTKKFPATRRSGEVLALDNLSLTVEDRRETTPEKRGEFVVLLGPSGCGKSTILTLISGLALPQNGEVKVYGQPVTGPHKFSASVPQAYTCFPWLNALENVEFGLSLQNNTSESQRRRVAMDYLTKVGLRDFAGAYHRQLSGGMQQRVAIARTLALKRPIVLMDEPFGALDAQTRADMQQMLLQAWAEEKNTIVFVTHDITEALLLADRVIVFSSRPARIVRDLTVPFPFERPPEIVHEAEFVRHAEDLRQLLGKPKPAVVAPAPGVGFTRLKSVPIAHTGPAAPAPAPAPAAAPLPKQRTPAPVQQTTPAQPAQAPPQQPAAAPRPAPAVPYPVGAPQPAPAPPAPIAPAPAAPAPAIQPAPAAPGPLPQAIAATMPSTPVLPAPTVSHPAATPAPAGPPPPAPVPAKGSAAPSLLKTIKGWFVKP